MTKIKICGLTREEDVDAAVVAGADAVGFVTYASSPRAVTVARAADLARRLPPFVLPVLLLVNEPKTNVFNICETLPEAILQFHGDESPAFCESFCRPYLRAARIVKGFDIVKYAQDFSTAQGLILDVHVETFGGSGRTFNWQEFNWTALSKNIKVPLILSGGLTAVNVSRGITLIKPWAVDVSSGVESSQGIKDTKKMADFIAAVKLTDSRSQ